MEVKNRKIKLTFSSVLCAVLILLFVDAILKYSSGLGQNNSAEKLITEFASQNGFTLDDYPMDIREMLVRNDETKDFVLNYPKKITHFRPDKLDFSEYKDCKEPPHLMQWDMRWGYMNYNGNVFGLTGSAPTCLSMAAIYVTHDVNMTPVNIAEFAKGAALVERGCEGRHVGKDAAADGAKNVFSCKGSVQSGPDDLEDGLYRLVFFSGRDDD